MTGRLHKLRSTILAELPASDITPLTDADLAKLVERHPDLPEYLRQLFSVVGVGRIVDGRYMIHGLLDPEEVYDPETASTLNGIVLVGDDFAGTCEAYDTKHGWRFGSIGASGEFSGSDDYADFIEFLERWYGGLAAG